MFESHDSSASSSAPRLLMMLLLLWSLQSSKGAMAPTGKDVDVIGAPVLLNNLTSTEPKSSAADSFDFLANVYDTWSQWTACNKKCQQSRKRVCKKERHCGKSYIKEKKTCKANTNCPHKTKKNRMKLLGLRKNGKFVKQILYKILYGAWTPWSVCSRSCKKERKRTCIQPAMCGDSFLQEERPCKRSSRKCRKQYILRTYVSDTDPDLSDTIKSMIVSSNNSTTKTGQPVNKKSKDTILLDLASTCGRQKASRRGTYRVVGGGESRKHAWPWQVAILEKWQEQFCGGTLIAPQWVLTAAHCVRKKNRKRKIFVRVGDHNIFASDVGEIKLKLEKDIPHPRYDFDTITNDIALLKLERPVNRSDTIDFACLPEKNDKLEKKVNKKNPKDKTMCYIVGWGKEKNTDPYGSSVLREAQVPLVDRETCQRAFDYVIHKTQICAGSRKGGIDSCAGDSGGPLLCQKRDADGRVRWVVYGVTSYGEGCGEKKKYGIYTNVRKYLDWINDIITQN